ncbi:MAG: PspC domain-containing protein [Arthrobacter sp.]|uniref:PspC domain-containing protein n=1 Tax=unclassified Arthrobacter TaxID=235627 RepID=UPI0026570559|nr:PspC domain-containing protein [Micrococcaceae bacterium]
MNHAPVENSFFRWLRGLGVERGEHHWIGGVSSGLGRRFGIDPALSRGLLLIVVVFSGVGLLLYGLAWALLPDSEGRIHLQQAGRGHWSSGMTGSLIFVVIGVVNGPSFLGGWRFDPGNSWWSSLIWTAIWVGAIIWFFSTRSTRRENRLNRQGPPAGHGPEGTTLDPEAPRASSMPPAGPDTPGSAAPSMAAGPAQPGKAPMTTTPPPRPVRARPALPGHTVAILLGVAVLVAGSVILTAMNGILDYGGREVTVALAAALTVLGAGLVGAALRSLRGGALTGFTIALLVPTLLVSGLGAQYAPSVNWPGPVVQRSGQEYTYVFNNGTLDLTPYGNDMKEDTKLSVTNVFSNLKIVIPEDVPVKITADSAFYSLQVPDDDGVRKYSGIASGDTINLNADADGPVLHLDIDGAFNSIDITSKEVTP